MAVNRITRLRSKALSMRTNPCQPLGQPDAGTNGIISSKPPHSDSAVTDRQAAKANRTVPARAKDGVMCRIPSRDHWLHMSTMPYRGAHPEFR